MRGMVQSRRAMYRPTRQQPGEAGERLGVALAGAAAEPVGSDKPHALPDVRMASGGLDLDLDLDLGLGLFVGHPANCENWFDGKLFQIENGQLL